MPRFLFYRTQEEADRLASALVLSPCREGEVALRTADVPDELGDTGFAAAPKQVWKVGPGPLSDSTCYPRCFWEDVRLLYVPFDALGVALDHDPFWTGLWWVALPTDRLLQEVTVEDPQWYLGAEDRAVLVDRVGSPLVKQALCALAIVLVAEQLTFDLSLYRPEANIPPTNWA